MNYQILNGKTATIGDTTYYNITVKKEIGVDGMPKWFVNDIPVRKMDLAIAVNIAESEQVVPRKWYQNIGLFFVKRKCDNTPEYGTILFKNISGIRTYGFNKCGVYFHSRFMDISFEVEFCWRDKDKYEKGEFPDAFVNYTKVF